jgi:hypothetical protein
MKINSLTLLSILLLTITSATAQKKYQIHTVAFYNFENLFDTINGPNNDEEYLPNGAQNWTGKKYKKKLDNLSKVLTDIGTGENPNAPTLIGGCEIENRLVLEDLVKHPKMINRGYGIIHFDSPDKRGIDVALLYQKKHFTPTSYVNIPLMIYRNQEAKVDKKEKEETTDDVIETTNNSESRVYTRDQLLVTGFLDGEEIHIIVNHWPSRSGGEKKSSPFREAAGKLNRKIMDSLFTINPNAKIITMGDLNDGSYNKSVKEEIGAKRKKEEVQPKGIFNPFEQMFKDGLGTLAYRDSWDIFDQIMISEPFVRKEATGFKYWKAGVFNKSYLIQTTGQYKGYPLRNSLTEPGYSDHFPVYIYLLKEIK